MEENKKNVVDLSCKTCTHSPVCAYRESMIIFANHLEDFTKEYIGKETDLNRLASTRINCVSYDPIISTRGQFINLPCC